MAAVPGDEEAMAEEMERLYGLVEKGVVVNSIVFQAAVVEERDGVFIMRNAGRVLVAYLYYDGLVMVYLGGPFNALAVLGEAAGVVVEADRRAADAYESIASAVIQARPGHEIVVGPAPSVRLTLKRRQAGDGRAELVARALGLDPGRVIDAGGCAGAGVIARVSVEAAGRGLACLDENLALRRAVACSARLAAERLGSGGELAEAEWRPQRLLGAPCNMVAAVLLHARDEDITARDRDARRAARWFKVAAAAAMAIRKATIDARDAAIAAYAGLYEQSWWGISGRALAALASGPIT